MTPPKDAASKRSGRPGKEVLVTIACSELTEPQALRLSPGGPLRLEAELIAALGTAANGRLLTNSVLPSDSTTRLRRNLVVPSGCIEKAQLGLTLLKEAVLELAKANPDGVTNSDVCHTLGLRSSYGTGSKDYLSWSVIGLLTKEGRLRRNDTVDKGRHQAQVR
jgi:uncharacterized protein